uniref:GOLD domain-containing protein n=1 Tax=Hyaloperonospora arabidopsidis (strain Emoy2) TaxID=559515 RepID=M4C2R6_HYAAE
MSLDIAVKVSPTGVSDARLDATARVLLHQDGHYQLIERSLRDFLHLERQIHAEIAAAAASPLSTSISQSIDAFYNANRSVYPYNQLSARLSIQLETFLLHLVLSSEFLATSRALKTFFCGNEWTKEETSARRYRHAVETALGDTDGEKLLDARVAAGCSMEHHETVEFTGAEEKQVVLWKFTSEGAGVIFRAWFSRTVETERLAIDPYSTSDNDVVENEANEQEVAYYRTHCTFKTGEKSFAYGHFVAETTGVLTLHWENVDKSSVMSKPLQFYVAVVSLSAANEVLEIADACNIVAEWLLCHIRTSSITSLDDLIGWNDDDCEDSAIVEDNAYSTSVNGEDPDLRSRLQSAVLEERNHELKARVHLATTKEKLKSAADRAEIAEEIYKANLETIALLERGKIGGIVPKSQKVAAASCAMSSDGRLDLVGAPMEQALSSELERMQNLCAGFQEQCLWRSVENMELETQLAASQIEASSWRKRHGEQAMQLKELEKQISTLRMHKKMLVHEVKRLQPFSHVNVAALVQEAQEARMVQRSLQAKLDLHEPVVSNDESIETLQSITESVAGEVADGP